MAKNEKSREQLINEAAAKLIAPALDPLDIWQGILERADNDEQTRADMENLCRLINPEYEKIKAQYGADVEAHREHSDACVEFQHIQEDAALYAGLAIGRRLKA